MRPVYAWYGDMELAPHLWQMVRLGRLTVRVEFHEPVTVERFGSRKALAEHCWRVVADGVDRAVSGRPRPVVRPLPEAPVEFPVAEAPHHKKPGFRRVFSSIQPFCSDRRLALADATLWTGISPASVIRIAACANLAAAVVALIQVDCR